MLVIAMLATVLALNHGVTVTGLRHPPPQVAAGTSSPTVFYPPTAQLKGLTGEVVVQCDAALDGALSHCAVLSEAPVGADFGAKAVQVADRLRLPRQTLAPLMNGDTLVLGAKVRLPVHFVLVDNPAPPGSSLKPRPPVS